MMMEKEKLVSLVLRAQQGDSDALNQLFNAFYNDVYYFALKTVKDESLACDITQESFVEMINTLGNLKEPAAFVTWMKQITYHQCTRYFKKKKDVLVDEDGASVFDTVKEEGTEFIPDEALDQSDFKKTILAILDGLSEEQRSATMMYYFDEMSVRQIAEIQGVSEGTVKSRLNYARKSIKASVEDYEKKNNIKLHAIPFFPFIKWVWGGEASLGTETVSAIAEGIAAATGTSVSVTSGATAGAAVAAGTTAAAVTTGTTGTATVTAAIGIGAKIAAVPLVTKIIAGIVAVAIIAGAATAGVLLSDSGNGTAADSSSVSSESADGKSDNTSLGTVSGTTQNKPKRDTRFDDWMVQYLAVCYDGNTDFNAAQIIAYFSTELCSMYYENNNIFTAEFFYEEVGKKFPLTDELRSVLEASSYYKDGNFELMGQIYSNTVYTSSPIAYEDLGNDEYNVYFWFGRWNSNPDVACYTEHSFWKAHVKLLDGENALLFYYSFEYSDHIPEGLTPVHPEADPYSQINYDGSLLTLPTLKYYMGEDEIALNAFPIFYPLVMTDPDATMLTADAVMNALSERLSPQHYPDIAQYGGKIPKDVFYSAAAEYFELTAFLKTALENSEHYDSTTETFTVKENGYMDWYSGFTGSVIRRYETWEAGQAVLYGYVPAVDPYDSSSVYDEDLPKYYFRAEVKFVPDGDGYRTVITYFSVIDYYPSDIY